MPPFLSSPPPVPGNPCLAPPDGPVMTPASDRHALHVCHVFAAEDMTVVSGANLGDPLGAADELCPGDVYAFRDAARALRLELRGSPAGRLRASEGCEAAPPGTEALREARLTFLSEDGSRAEALVLSLGRRRVFLPLGPLDPASRYTLVDTSGRAEAVPLADAVSVAFTRGTRIALADGRHWPADRLTVGDMVLTRDNGPQPLRHLLRRTVPAAGAFAPVAIAAGTLGNPRDLVVGQHQRLFVYQRGPDRLTERAEMLIRAGDLADGEAVAIRRGGFADYVSLVFDRHEVVYAECVPAESLLVNATTRPGLPEEVRAALDAALPGLAQAPIPASDAPRAALAEARARLIRTPKG